MPSGALTSDSRRQMPGRILAARPRGLGCMRRPASIDLVPGVPIMFNYQLTARARALLLGLVAVVALPVFATPPAAQSPSQTVARLRITPAVRTIAVGDSLRLVVQALDAQGNVVPGAIIHYNARGGHFQATV